MHGFLYNILMLNDLKTKYKIITWNILENCHYEQRLQLIADHIKALDADIVLLQETADEFSQLATDIFAKAGYTLKLNPGTGTRISGVGIAYRPDVFQELPFNQALHSSVEEFSAMSLDLIPLDRLPARHDEPKYMGYRKAEVETPLDYGNDILTVVSYHGQWGTLVQPDRLAEVVAIDQFAKAKGNAVILGGDFNATPNEPAVQYLKGGLIVDGYSTLWIEAQELITDLGGPAPYGTSFAHGAIVDAKARFDHSRTPERHIDYLFNYGYCYGRQYAFDGWRYDVNTDRARELSDHAPILAGLLA